MFCAGCGKLHRPGTEMTGMLDGKNYCDRTYWAARRIILASERLQKTGRAASPNHANCRE